MNVIYSVVTSLCVNTSSSLFERDNGTSAWYLKSCFSSFI